MERLRMATKTDDAEAKMFDFDPKHIDWEDYFSSIHIPANDMAVITVWFERRSNLLWYSCTVEGSGFRRATGPTRKKWEQQGPARGGWRDWRRGWSSDEGGGRVAAASSSCCGRGGRGKEYGRMGAAAAEKGAIVVDAGAAAAVWLKHGCAPAGWGCRRHMGATTATTKARMSCGSRKRRRRYCAPAGKKKERATAAKQRRQRGNSSSEEEWQAAANDGWQRWQVRSREEGSAEGVRLERRRRQRRCAATAVGEEEKKRQRRQRLWRHWPATGAGEMGQQQRRRWSTARAGEMGQQQRRRWPAARAGEEERQHDRYDDDDDNNDVDDDSNDDDDDEWSDYGITTNAEDI
ncbi:hypothetical protein B296_00000870 [Ensete ventricosum]|uniref:Fatty acyl-CoA reductase C-terminal domain-containing protein n=1 Tax=Ensete ventricosum TaxID=4639 RepID=A0A426ZGL8_ENSVE|nr:hypothetical protein B296_00000870 [Ensete ventricosum]